MRFDGQRGRPAECNAPCGPRNFIVQMGYGQVRGRWMVCGTACVVNASCYRQKHHSRLGAQSASP